MSSNVVVTGTGLITPLGDTVSETWTAMQNGECGIGEPQLFDSDQSRQLPPFASEVTTDLSDSPHIDERRMGKFIKLAISAAVEAVDDAGLDPEADEWQAERVGTSIGTCFGGLEELTEATEKAKQGERISSFQLVSGMLNLGAGYVSMVFDARGPNRSPVTACAAGSQSIADAANDIRQDRADIMIAGSADGGFEVGAVGGFGAMRALNMNDDFAPSEASRPFDTDRSGFVMGEGAGILILESSEHAEERGAEILAEVSGTGQTADASHPSGPREDAAGLTAAIETALDDAGVPSAAVDNISAHATSTPAGDKHESRAINQAFDDANELPPVTATKSMLGHSGGGSGSVEAVLAVCSIQDDYILPTLNCDDKDPECNVPVPTAPITDQTVDCVLSNSAGFGGVNVALVIENHE